MREIGLEPTRHLRRQDLNLVRLPISPPPHTDLNCTDFFLKVGHDPYFESSVPSLAPVNWVCNAKRRRLNSPQVILPFKNSF